MPLPSHVGPTAAWTNIVFVMHGLCSQLVTAILVGLVVARFCTPNCHVMFAMKALITYKDGQLCFLTRLCNQRADKVLANCTVSCYCYKWFISSTGQSERRQFKVKLQRNSQAKSRLVKEWDLIHIINEDSPLKSFTAESMIKGNVEIAFFFTGLDTTHNDPIYTAQSYVCEDIVMGGQFADMHSYDQREQQMLLNLDLLSKVVPCHKDNLHGLHVPGDLPDAKWSQLLPLYKNDDPWNMMKPSQILSYRESLPEPTPRMSPCNKTWEELQAIFSNEDMRALFNSIQSKNNCRTLGYSVGN